jgi:segregation and condensation protein A
LLQLIERAELDITKLALAQITDQFLAYLHTLDQTATEEVSAFLVVASRLMQIKSEALLPRPVEREPGEEDPGEMLINQLIVYKRYKELAEHLSDRDIVGLRSYLRLAPPPKVEGKLDLSGVSVLDLLNAAQYAFSMANEKAPLETVVNVPKVTIREKINLITETLRSHGRATFRSLIRQRLTRMDIVVTFLAMLELIKRFQVTARQEKLFGDIEIQPAEEWDDSAEFEIEFAE